MKETKFKIGDWVDVLMPPNTGKEYKLVAHILEVRQCLCESNIEQTSYIIKMWVQEKSTNWGFARSVEMREMELGEKIEPI